MHEFGVTEAIIVRLLKQLEREKVSKVEKVTFCRSSAFSEAVLRQTFDALSVGTPLAGAELVVDVALLDVPCNCGRTSQVHSEDLIGHMFICPNCGMLKEIAEAHDLELLEVIAESEDCQNELQA